ncbi:hypothetical protein D3C71_1540920 [compost metagenome]
MKISVLAITRGTAVDNDLKVAINGLASGSFSNCLTMLVRSLLVSPYTSRGLYPAALRSTSSSLTTST